MVRHTIPLALALLLTFAACGSDDAGNSDSTRLWVDSDVADCTGEAEQECLQVARSQDGPFELFYDPIEGFSFEEGNTYVIDVTIDELDDPPADGSSLRYTLVEIVEQAAVDS